MERDRRLLYLYIYIYIFFSVSVYLVIWFTLGETDGLTTVRPDFIYRSLSISFIPTFISVLILKRYLWRYSWVQYILKIDVPYINGRWEGHIESTYTDHETQHPVAIEISQTLDTVSIWYYDKNAITRSLVADFASPTEGGPVKLYCVYRNEPTTTDDPGLQSHNGVMELYVNEKTDSINGIYYNNQHERETYGNINVELTSRKLYHSFEP